MCIFKKNFLKKLKVNDHIPASHLILIYFITSIVLVVEDIM